MGCSKNNVEPMVLTFELPFFQAEQINHKQYLVVQIHNSEIVKSGTAKC